MILAPSQTAACPATCSLSCQDEDRKVGAVAVTTGTGDVEREAEEEEERPTEEDGRMNISRIY